MTCFTRNIDMKSHEAMEIVGCAFRWLRFGYGLKTPEEELERPQGGHGHYLLVIYSMLRTIEICITIACRVIAKDSCHARRNA